MEKIDSVIVGKSYSDSDYACRCQYCGKECKSIQTLRSHYRDCNKRLLMRYYICGNFLFGIYCNPGKYLLSIDEEAKKSGDAKLTLGGIRAHQFNNGKIKRYMAVSIKNDNNILYPNGSIRYNDIKYKMTAEEIKQLEIERATLIIPELKTKI